MKEQIQKLIDEFYEDIETYTQYKAEYDPENEYDRIYSLIDNLDIDSIDFNAGFEKGYMFALRQIERIITN